MCIFNFWFFLSFFFLYWTIFAISLEISRNFVTSFSLHFHTNERGEVASDGKYSSGYPSTFRKDGRTPPNMSFRVQRLYLWKFYLYISPRRGSSSSATRSNKLCQTYISFSKTKWTLTTFPKTPTYTNINFFSSAVVGPGGVLGTSPSPIIFKAKVSLVVAVWSLVLELFLTFFNLSV